MTLEGLEPVKEFVLGRREDIENDIEDFGMLQPALNYFLREASGVIEDLTALKVREKALAQAERIFQEATAQVLKVYDEAIAQAWEVYEEASG